MCVFPKKGRRQLKKKVIEERAGGGAYNMTYSEIPIEKMVHWFFPYTEGTEGDFFQIRFFTQF